jgi:hypothetical protein
LIRFLGFLFVILCIIILGYRELYIGDPAEFAKYVVRSHVVEYTDDAALLAALQTLTKHTVFENVVNVNTYPKDDHVNIYLYDPAKIPSYRLFPAAYKNNCLYTGKINIILCDVGFMKRFLSVRGLDETWRCSHDARSSLDTCPDVYRSLARDDRKGLLVWAIGHEIGHLIHHDGPRHFVPSALEASNPSSEIQQKPELEADEYMEAQLQNDPVNLFNVHRLLIDILNFEIRKAVCTDQDPRLVCNKLPSGVGIIYDYNRKELVKYRTDLTHPEYVIRGTRLLWLAATMYHDLDMIGMEHLLESLVASFREQRNASDAEDAPNPALVDVANDFALPWHSNECARGRAHCRFEVEAV